MGERPNPNEAKATGTLRVLTAALKTYASVYDAGFPDRLRRLGRPRAGQPDKNNANLVDPVIAGQNGGSGISFEKDGYFFTYHAGAADRKGRIHTYSLIARPLRYGDDGYRSFFTDEAAVIHWTAEDRAPNASDFHL